MALSGQSAAPDEARWSVILAGDGTRIGHVSRQVLARPDGREIVRTREIALQELDAPRVRIIERTVRLEDRNGRTLRITEESTTGPDLTRSVAEIGEDAAEIVRQTRSDRRRLRVALPTGTRFDGGDALLATWDPVRQPRLEFDDFDLGAMTVDHVVIEALGSADTRGGIEATRQRFERGELRSVARIRIERGRIVSTTQRLFGATLTIAASDRNTAISPHAAFHVLRNSAVRSPFRISAAAAQNHIRYSFAYRDGMRFPLPATGEQRVTLGAVEAVLDICSSCGPGLASDPAALAEARRPTAWLESDHARLRSIAAPIARMQVSGAEKMRLLRLRGRPYLARIDFTGHFSALETMRRRAGDCTEAAVLLAALGRAAGIPTRVASGLVYARSWYHGTSNVFMPHSWTLAYVDGAWRSFDLALDEFDATHIALTVGDGDARSIAAASQLAGMLELREMREVRSRAAN